MPKKWQRRKKTPKDPFDAGWESSVSMFASAHELSVPGISKARKASQKKIHRDAVADLFRAEDFAAREAARLVTARAAAAAGAAKRNERVVAAIREAAEAGELNKSKTIRELRKSGSLTPAGATKSLHDATARRIMKKLGVAGKPGRKKTT